MSCFSSSKLSSRRECSWIRCDAEIRGHDHDGVLEVDRAALRIGEAAVVEDLEEDVEDVGVRLLDLVEEEHGIRVPADLLGELASLLVAHVAGRRADEARDGVALLELAHVEAHHQGLVAEERLREGTRELRLAHTGRPEEEEAADGPVRVAEPGARAAHGLRDGRDGLVLADDATVELLLEPKEALALLGGELRDGDAGGAGDDLRDVLRRHLGRALAALAPIVERRPGAPRSGP